MAYFLFPVHQSTVDAAMSALDTYTPGGVSSALAAAASSAGKPGRHRSENEAVVALFSKDVMKYDYSTPKSTSGEASAAADKKRKHKNKRQQGARQTPSKTDSNGTSMGNLKAYVKKQKHDAGKSHAHLLEISKNIASAERESVKGHAGKEGIGSDVSCIGKKQKRKSRRDSSNMNTNVDKGVTRTQEGESPKKKKKRKQSMEAGPSGAKILKLTEGVKCVWLYITCCSN